LERIFVVEDEPALCELYECAIDGAGMDVRIFSSGESFFNELENSLPDLIILDIMLPGMDGYEILSVLKKNSLTFSIPVIMVSAKGEEISKVKGLNMGADDYIGKPFGVMELIARIKANLRKTPKIKSPQSIKYKDIMIDDTTHTVSVAGKNIHITLKEYNLLAFFVSAPNIVHNRETIFKEVWDEDFVGETRTLDMHVKQLRSHLQEYGSTAEIETVRGIGFILK